MDKPNLGRRSVSFERLALLLWQTWKSRNIGDSELKKLSPQHIITSDLDASGAKPASDLDSFHARLVADLESFAARLDSDRASSDAQPDWDRDASTAQITSN